MKPDLYERAGPIFGRWWRGLNDSDGEGARGERADRADIARLKRVSLLPEGVGSRVDVAAAMTIEAFRNLYGRIRPVAGELSDWEDRLAVAAITLAHVREEAPGGSTARLLAGPDADHKVMAESRFLRLLRARSPADLLDEGRRAVALLKGKAPVEDLGGSLLVWPDDAYRRRQWAQAYYGLGAPPPSDTRNSEPHAQTGATAP